MAAARTTRPRGRPSNLRSRLSRIPTPVWLAVAALAAFLVYRHYRGSSSATLDTSGNPAATSGTGNNSVGGGGGGGNAASNLPDVLISQPDPLTSQVQQNDTTSPEAPTMQASGIDTVTTPTGTYVGAASPDFGLPGNSAVPSATIPSGSPPPNAIASGGGGVAIPKHFTGLEG